MRDLWQEFPGAVLVHGDHPLCDRKVAVLWRALGGTDEPHPADWRAHGRAAGPIRNKEMIYAGADAVVAFIRDGSPGASGTARMADAVGIPVRVYVDNEE